MVTIFAIADFTSVKIFLLRAGLFCKWSENNGKSPLVKKRRMNNSRFLQGSNAVWTKQLWCFLIFFNCCSRGRLSWIYAWCHQPAGLTLLLLYRGHSNTESEPTGWHSSQQSHWLTHTEVSSLCEARWWHRAVIYSLSERKKCEEKTVKERGKKQ